MRVIAGYNKGRKLISPKVSFIRPTSDRTKQFIFDYLGDTVENAYVLDLFSGTGNLGIEALSRGAEKVIYIDQEKKAAEIIHKNIRLTHYEDKSNVIIKDAIRYLNNIARNNTYFDLIFADPPYNYVSADKLIELIDKNNLLGSKGLLVLEHSRLLKIENNYKNLILIKSRRLGDTTVSIFKGNNEETEL
jgi:16S rRNA (guanine(966)-N(2))-methyltransferase RsmD